MNTECSIAVQCHDDEMDCTVQTSISSSTHFHEFMGHVRQVLNVAVDQRLRLHWTAANGDLNTLCTAADLAEAMRSVRRCSAMARPTLLLTAHRESVFLYSPGRLPPIAEVPASNITAINGDVDECGCEVESAACYAGLVCDATAEELAPLLPGEVCSSAADVSTPARCYETRLAARGSPLPYAKRTRVRLGPSAEDAECERLLGGEHTEQAEDCFGDFQVSAAAVPTMCSVGTMTAPATEMTAVHCQTDVNAVCDAAVNTAFEIVERATAMYDEEVLQVSDIECRVVSAVDRQDDDDDAETLVNVCQADCVAADSIVNLQCPPTPPASLCGGRDGAQSESGQIDDYGDDDDAQTLVGEDSGPDNVTASPVKAVPAPFLPMSTAPISLTLSLRIPAGDQDGWPVGTEDLLPEESSTPLAQNPGHDEWLDGEEFEVVSIA